VQGAIQDQFFYATVRQDFVHIIGAGLAAASLSEMNRPRSLRSSRHQSSPDVKPHRLLPALAPLQVLKDRLFRYFVCRPSLLAIAEGSLTVAATFVGKVGAPQGG